MRLGPDRRARLTDHCTVKHRAASHVPRGFTYGWLGWMHECGSTMFAPASHRPVRVLIVAAATASLAPLPGEKLWAVASGRRPGSASAPPTLAGQVSRPWLLSRAAAGPRRP